MTPEADDSGLLEQVVDGDRSEVDIDVLLLAWVENPEAVTEGVDWETVLNFRAGGASGSREPTQQSRLIESGVRPVNS